MFGDETNSILTQPNLLKRDRLTGSALRLDTNNLIIFFHRIRCMYLFYCGRQDFGQKSAQENVSLTSKTCKTNTMGWWIRLCPLACDIPNPCQQHHKLPSSLALKRFPGPNLLYFAERKWKGESKIVLYRIFSPKITLRWDSNPCPLNNFEAWQVT